MDRRWCSGILAGLGLLFVAAAPATAQPFSLNEAMGTAYETNPQLAAQQASLRATDEQVAQANGGWRPTINAQASYGYEQFGFKPIAVLPGGTVSTLSEHPFQDQLTVTEPIFRGGRTYAEIRRAKALVRAGRAQLIGVEQTVLLQAVTAYMNVVLNSAVVKLRQANVGVLTKQRDERQAEFHAGSLTRTDVAQSDARLSGAEADLTTAEGLLAASRADFLQTIGRPAETLDDNPALPEVPGSAEDIAARALKENPAVVQARENERAAVFAVDDAIGALLPQLSVQGQYFYSQGNKTSSFGGSGGPAGLTDHGVSVLGLLNVPIYQGGADEATVRQSRELHDQATQNLNLANTQVQDAATSAWANFQSALGTIKSTEATQEADQIAYEGVSKEQQVGSRTVLDVLNAQQELLNAEVAVVTAKRNTVVAAYQVLAATGALTAKDLGLKVKFYDPVEHYDDDESRWIGFGD